MHTSLQKQLKKLTKTHTQKMITKEHRSENYLCKNFGSKQGRAFGQEGDIPYSGKFSRGPIFVEGQSSKILRSNFRGWLFQNCSAHNTWLTPPLTACTCRLKNSGVGVLPGSYATFLQNELLSIKAHRCSHSILSSVFSYLKSGENFS